MRQKKCKHLQDKDTGQSYSDKLLQSSYMNLTDAIRHIPEEIRKQRTRKTRCLRPLLYLGVGKLRVSMVHDWRCDDSQTRCKDVNQGGFGNKGKNMQEDT